MNLVQIVGAYDRNQGMDPGHLLALIERLPDTSMFHALRVDADNWHYYLGHGEDRQLLQGIFDVARAGGNWKKPPPTWPRPADRIREANKGRKTVEDAMAFFMGMGGKVL